MKFVKYQSCASIIMFLRKSRKYNCKEQKIEFLMHYATLKRIRSQQKEVPEHVSCTNEFSSLEGLITCFYDFSIQVY